MAPELTDREREAFAELHERLEGVARAEPSSTNVTSTPGPIDPMLATTFDGDLETLEAGEWIAEQKFDGTRLLLEKFDGEATVYSRRHVDRTDAAPELVATAEQALPDGVYLDGEYAFVDEDGITQFYPIHTRDERIESTDLTAKYFVFDVLVANHQWMTRESLTHRKDLLDDIVPETEAMTVVGHVSDGLHSFYDDRVDRGEEGIMIKRRESIYHQNTRSEHWRKVKAIQETDAIAIGYTEGEGARSQTFGALVLTDGDRYVGRVGSGFTQGDLEQLDQSMTPIEDRPIAVDTVGAEYTPVEPFVVKVEYQDITKSGRFRAPVFLYRRPDKPVNNVVPIARSTS